MPRSSRWDGRSPSSSHCARASCPSPTAPAVRPASARAMSSPGWPRRRRSPRWPTSLARGTSAARSTRSSPTTRPPGSRTSSPSVGIRRPTPWIDRATTPMRPTCSTMSSRRVTSRSVSPPTLRSIPSRRIARPTADISPPSCAVADFAITQFFFEAQHYVRLVTELAELGVDKPVIPGIMPLTNLTQISRMAQLSGAEVPSWVVDAVSSFDDARRRSAGRRGDRLGAVCGAAGSRCAGVALLHDEPFDGDS